ncbi:hypothetical protein PBRA_002031 [Plasmodiophora brassicae]|uniref:Ubiquitin carboxyl-terminal hydrolase n=1 Tax=Plasmodiophora brassicae TaxID=37360 RepID=A0A0G4J1G4_PLABS|nr:hypothetical protein PBRA_002031 [Plasmodiophora brassicae]
MGAERNGLCPHLEGAQVDSRALLLQFLHKCRESRDLNVCSDCKQTVPEGQTFLCLQCYPSDVARCGRSLNKDAMKHAQEANHQVSINTATSALWCYACDDEVFFNANVADEDDEDGDGVLVSRDKSPERRPSARESPNPITRLLERRGYRGDGSWRFTSNVSGGRTGFANLGNTCYLNSGLQAIIHVPQIIAIFGQQRFLSPSFTTGTRYERLLVAFAILITKVWEGAYEVCVPRDFVRELCMLNPVFRGYDQQDTQEFLRCLVDALHEALKHRTPIPPPPDEPDRVAAEDRSLVSDLFQGLLLSQVTCGVCGNVSEVYDPFMDLSLEIPTKQQLKRLSDALPNESSKTSLGVLGSFLSTLSWSSPNMTLEQCLHSFCSRESLVKLDQYKCEKCNLKVNAHKVLSIGRCPEILTLHIKRFAHNSYWGSKLSTPVEFPLRGLDLSPFIKKTRPNAQAHDAPPVYDLVSLVRHIGSVNGGHYIAYAKHHLTGQWYEFDDRSVTAVAESDIVSQEAYILLYAKRLPQSKDPRPFDAFIERSLALKDDDTSRSDVFLSLYWLKKAEILSHPGPIDNWSLCCEHGVPREGDPSDEKALRISSAAYDSLVDKFGGGPRVDAKAEGFPASDCSKCLAGRRKLEKRRISILDNDSTVTRVYYLIAEQWLASWRDFISGGTGVVLFDNSVLLEEDGETPKPGLAVAKDYRGVGVSVWREFVRLYGGGPAIVRHSIDLYEPTAKD